MLVGLTRVTRTTEKDSVGTSGALNSELIEGHALTTVGDNASTSTLGEAEGADGELGELQQALIVHYGTNEDSDVGLLTLHVASNLGERQRCTVHAGHTKSLQHNSVERSISTPGEEAVELHQQQEVRVLGDRLRPVAVLHMLMIEIDTLLSEKKLESYPTKRKTSYFQIKTQQEVENDASSRENRIQNGSFPIIR